MSTNFSEQLEYTKNILKQAEQAYKKITFANSLSIEDMLITDLLIKEFPNIHIFTLDTGRLHEETLLVIESIEKIYNRRIEVLYPNHEHLEPFVQQKGINAFYESVELRKKCCYLRKVEPLKRALKNQDAWITGIRKDQSITRQDLKDIQWDEGNNLNKINPLLNWSEDKVWEYIKYHNVPYNQLYHQKFTSIGCAPCTRAIEVGEDVRSGRWWWENPDTKECGLHIKPNR